MSVRDKYETFEIEHAFRTGAEITMGVRIKKGRFAGMEYHYKTVSFNEDENGTTHVQFDYKVLKDPKRRHNPQSRKMINLMGRILMDIIEQDQQEKDGVSDEHGNGNVDTESDGSEG